MTKQELYNVYAVDIETNKRELIAESKTESNAEAIINMAVMRRGVETHFFQKEAI